VGGGWSDKGSWKKINDGGGRDGNQKLPRRDPPFFHEKQAKSSLGGDSLKKEKGTSVIARPGNHPDLQDWEGSPELLLGRGMYQKGKRGRKGIRQKREKIPVRGRGGLLE